MTSQEKFLAALRAIATTKKLDLVVDMDFANIGTARFQQDSDFSDLLAVKFNFQSGAATIELEPVSRFSSKIYCRLGSEDLNQLLAEIERIVGSL
jgi:hypothetical protein